uniref:Metalloendopeptidase n=1 Tax=Timema bartmani TaxID=61472 RepID=A0A7R9F0Y6_9NEOP|nr:unnamed protein product [Timema bartmani]
MHAVGFWHEQSRGDRDHFVTVLWDNIQRGMEFNFYKFSSRVMQDLDTAYDTSSVMHYGMYSFSKDRRSPTIIPKRENTVLLGQRRGFSQTDIVKVNRLYECGSGVAPISPIVPAGAKPAVRCEDHNQHCERWATIGECANNPDYMNIYCAKACGACSDGGSTSCEDRSQHCKFWAKSGQCQENPSYMLQHCRRACQMC